MFALVRFSMLCNHLEPRPSAPPCLNLKGDRENSWSQVIAPQRFWPLSRQHHTPQQSLPNEVRSKLVAHARRAKGSGGGLRSGLYSHPLESAQRPIDRCGLTASSPSQQLIYRQPMMCTAWIERGSRDLVGELDELRRVAPGVAVLFRHSSRAGERPAGLRGLACERGYC